MAGEAAQQMILRKDVARSLLALGLVVGFALAGLMTDGNWPKVGRVAMASSGYAIALLILLRTGEARWVFFAAAGATAGIISALARPEFVASIVPAQVAGALSASYRVAAAAADVAVRAPAAATATAAPKSATRCVRKYM